MLLSELTSPAEQPSLKGTVLLVDDEPEIVRLYGRTLRRAGFRVLELTNGDDIAGVLTSTDVDVLLTDLAMPTRNGIQILQAVHQTNPGLPVILMTGAADLTTAIDAVQYGALRYLVKPVESSALVAAMECAMEARQSAQVTRLATENYRHATEQAMLRTDLNARFDRALQSLFMVYQPIVRWSDRSVLGYEALVRTAEPSLSRPMELFAAAEELDRVADVGRATRRSVAETLQSTATPAFVFVNVHPADLADDDLLSANSPLSAFAPQVILEITERTSLESSVSVETHLSALRQLGYRIALDDLGAGYAGLTAFTRIHPEVVKLDMSLVRDVPTDRTKQLLIGTLVHTCRELGIVVVAEGVETPEERRTLVDLKCDVFQGYLFAKPGLPFPAATFAVTPGP